MSIFTQYNEEKIVWNFIILKIFHIWCVQLQFLKVNSNLFPPENIYTFFTR